MTRCRHRDQHHLYNWVSMHHHHQTDPLLEEQQDVEQEEEPAVPVNEDVCPQGGQEGEPAEAVEEGGCLQILSEAAGGPMTRSRTIARNRMHL